jgi:hypothetical protein
MHNGRLAASARPIALAMGLLFATGCAASSTGPAARHAGNNTLVQDWQATVDQGTARLSLSIGESGQAVAVQQGYVDFKHNSLSLMSSGTGGGATEVRDVGGYTYRSTEAFELSVASEIASLSSSLDVQPPSSTGGMPQWFKSKDRSTQGVLGSLGPLGLVVSTEQTLATYSKDASVQDVGTATVLGAPTTHYRLTSSQRLPGETAPAGEPSIAAGTISTLNLDFYVDSNNLVRRISFQVSAAQSGAPPEVYTQTLELSDFGAPVTVSAPPSSALATP